MDTAGIGGGGFGGGMPAVGGMGGGDMGAPAAATGSNNGPGSMQGMFSQDSFTPCASGGG
jgi:hypothetical protein